jgi:hypothetical protein
MPQPSIPLRIAAAPVRRTGGFVAIPLAISCFLRENLAFLIPRERNCE